MPELIAPVREAVRRPEVKTYRPGLKGLGERVKGFIGVTEKVQAVAEQVPQEQIDRVSGMGFFERLGFSIDNGIGGLKEKATHAWSSLKEKMAQSGERFKAKGEEIQERRKKMGIVDTAVSYVKDGVDKVRSGVDTIEARWKSAEVNQLVGERARLRASYEEAKRMKAAGEVVPEGFITSRSQLREALRPIRSAELAARAERRNLRHEAKVLRGRVERKQNARELLARAKNKNKAPVGAPEMASAAAAI